MNKLFILYLDHFIKSQIFIVLTASLKESNAAIHFLLDLSTNIQKRIYFIIFLHLMSKEDKIDSILDSMSQENDPQALSEGLNILCKLTAK